MGLANSGRQLKWARALLGLAEGPINIGSVSVINKWFPTQEKGIAMGLYLSSIKFAPAFVPPLCAWLIMTYGWRSVFYAFAVPGFFLTVLWYFFVRDNPRDSKFVNEAEVHYIENPVIPSVAEKKDATDNTSTSIGGTLDRLIRTRIVEPLANNAQILRFSPILGRDALAKMKPSSILINAARGGVVDEVALVEALKENRIFGAAVDAFVEEPVPKNHRLFSCGNFVGTPHSGANTADALTRMGTEAVDEIVRFKRGEATRTRLGT